jgi:hypothetical protein
MFLVVCPRFAGELIDYTIDQPPNRIGEYAVDVIDW